MRTKKIIRKGKKIELIKKCQFYDYDEKIFTIDWNSKKKIFCFGFKYKYQPFALFDPEIRQIYASMEMDIDSVYMKLTKSGDKLIVLDKYCYIHVIQLKNFETLEIIELPDYNILSFVFCDKLCETVYVNSNYLGLYKIDLSTGKLKKLNIKGFYLLKKIIFCTSSDFKIIYGHSEFDQFHILLCAYNVARGFKYRSLAMIYTEYRAMVNTLSKNDSLLISGNFIGELIVNDLRSYKNIITMRLESENSIKCLESKGKFIYGATKYNEFFIIDNLYPFSVIYY